MDLFAWFRKRRPDPGPGRACGLHRRQCRVPDAEGTLRIFARARRALPKVLFREPEFQAAIETARWRAFPLGLAMVAEMVEGVLRAHVGEQRRAAHEALSDIVLDVFDRYPVPAALGADEWREHRAELARRLQLAGLHAPKRAMDIPEQWAQTYFDLMPIHEKLRSRDFPTTRNYLRVAMCNIHDEFSERLDVPAVTSSLSGATV